MRTKTISKTLFWFIAVGAGIVLFTPLIISSNTLFPFQVGKAITYRVLIEIIAFFYLWLALIEPKFRPQKTSLLIAILAYGLVLILTALTGVNPYRSFWGDVERMEGVFGIWHGILFFLVLGSVFQTKEAWLNFFKISLFVSILVFYFAWQQFIKAPNALISSSATPGSTLGNAAFAATYVIFQMFFALIVFVWEREKYSKSLSGSRQHYLSLFWLIYSSVLFLINFLYLNMTAIRGGQVGFVFSIFVLGGLLSFWSQGFLKKFAIGLVILTLMFPIFIYLGKDKPWMAKMPHSIQRLAKISFERDPTLNTRLISLGISWQAFKEKPIFGWGQENFRVGYNKHFNPEHLTFEQAWFDRAHNKIAEVAVMTGALGLLAYLMIFITALFGLVRVVRTQVTKKIQEKTQSIISNGQTMAVVAMITIALGGAYFVQNLFLFDMPASYMLFFSSLAFVQFLITKNLPDRRQKKQFEAQKKSLTSSGSDSVSFGRRWFEKRGARRMILVAAGALTLFLILGANWRPYLAARWGLKVLASQTPETALTAFKKAEAYDHFPFAETLRASNSFLLRNNLARSKEWFDFTKYVTEKTEKFLAKEPIDPRYFLLLGKVYNQMAVLDPAYFSKAQRALNEALRWAPKRPDTFYELAITFLGMGDKKNAIEMARQAYQLNPKNKKAQWNLGLVLAIAGDYKKALVTINQAIAAGYNWMNETDIQNLHRIYSATKQYDRLVQMYEVLTKKFPNRAQFYVYLALSYAELGEREKAIAAAEKAALIDPNFTKQAGDFIQKLEGKK